MTFIGYEPWREYLYKGINTPVSLVIPVSDIDAWQLYPKHNWIYNKIEFLKSLDQIVAPLGVTPYEYPVICKPITNLFGMGDGVYIVDNEKQYNKMYHSGYFWMKYAKGRHWSIDLICINGEVVDYKVAEGNKMFGFKFSYWETHMFAPPKLINKMKNWISKNLKNYTGVFNFESIGNTIIEGHLRFSDQFADLYEDNFIQKISDLYTYGNWEKQKIFKKGYSQVLWKNKAKKYKILLHESFYDKDVKIQFTREEFHGIPSENSYQPNPAGYCRVAIINSFDYQKSLVIKNKLDKYILPVEK